jgi:hypothetical protein
MSQRVLKWLLWLLLVCTVPLPYFMIENGRVPAAQLFIFAAVTAPMLVSDPGFTTRFVAALFISQSLFYGATLYLLARGSARRIHPSRRLLLAALAAAALGVLALCDVYRAPLSHGPGRTNIVGVFLGRVQGS